MPCPTCDHTMQNLGVESERKFWCPRCGTIKTVAGEREEIEAPALVQHVAKAEDFTIRTSVDGATIQFAVIDLLWRNICEAAGVKVHGT